MINDILDVSKAHASTLEIKRSSVDFNQLLLDTYAEVKPLASRQQITLSCAPAAGLNKISVDQDKLYRVLINLISNAIQHTPREGKIDIRCTVKTQDQLLEIAISDNGCGISKEDQTMIFERFWSGSTQKDTKRSSGLGLAFCKLACEAHGGKVSVSSQLGHGSTFTVTLPIMQ
jgi:signal transduction histidine kinase